MRCTGSWRSATARTSLRLRPKWIGTAEAAIEYFQGAFLRTEKVFVSYSGRDQEVASRLSRRLKETFEDVFDYRDGQSIPAGVSWLERELPPGTAADGRLP